MIFLTHKFRTETAMTDWIANQVAVGLLPPTANTRQADALDRSSEHHILIAPAGPGCSSEVMQAFNETEELIAKMMRRGEEE